MTRNENRGRQYLIAILFALFFPPLLIVLHELGHYSAGRLLGYSPNFSYAAVSVFRPMDWTHLFLFTLAGPCVELSVCVAGLIGLCRLRGSLPMRCSWKVWLWSSLAGAGLRWIKAPFDGIHGDEASLSAMLGLHHLFLPLALLAPAAAVAGILVQFHRRNRTLLPLVISSVVGGLAVVMWLTFVGPALLPKPSGP